MPDALKDLRLQEQHIYPFNTGGTSGCLTCGSGNCADYTACANTHGHAACQAAGCYGYPGLDVSYTYKDNFVVTVGPEPVPCSAIGWEAATRSGK